MLFLFLLFDTVVEYSTSAGPLVADSHVKGGNVFGLAVLFFSQHTTSKQILRIDSKVIVALSSGDVYASYACKSIMGNGLLLT